MASPRYLASAFTLQYNLILLGGSALFALASASLAPLLFGLAGEAVWLTLAPRLPAFRRFVDSRAGSRSAPPPPHAQGFQLHQRAVPQLGQRASQPDGVAESSRVSVFPVLDAVHSARLTQLERVIAEVRAFGADSNDPDYELAASKLELLLPEFRKLSAQHERLLRFLEEVRKPELETEISELAQAFSVESDLGLRMTLRQARTQAERRLEQRARILATSRAAEIKLRTIERSIGHCRGIGLVSASDLVEEAEALVLQLGSLAQTLEKETQALASSRGAISA